MGKTRAAFAIGGTARTKMTSAAMPGVPSYAQAQRMAVERYNHAVIEDLTGSIVVLQDAIENVTIGDVCTVDDPVNGVNQDFRIMGIDLVGTGRYQLRLREYQASAYSDVVPADPGAPDTDLPSPLIIPQVGNVSATKSEILTGDGVRQTRLNVTWDIPTFASPAQDWPFVDHYEIQVLTTASSPDVLQFTGTSIDNEWQSPPILDGVAYLARVRIINTLAQPGPWSTDTITPTLDTTAPATPATPVAVQGAGDFINVDWAANADADLWYYELHANEDGGSFVKVGNVGGITTQYWEGTYGNAYRFKIAAVDRAGNVSSLSSQSNSISYDKNIDENHIEDDGVTQPTIEDAAVNTARRGERVVDDVVIDHARRARIDNARLHSQPGADTAECLPNNEGGNHDERQHVVDVDPVGEHPQRNDGIAKPDHRYRASLVKTNEEPTWKKSSFISLTGKCSN